MNSQKWEYLQFDRPSSHTMKFLGSQGWELVSVLYITRIDLFLGAEGHVGEIRTAVFKRPVESLQAQTPAQGTHE